MVEEKACLVLVTHTVDKDLHCRRDTLSGMVATQRFDHLRCIGKRELFQASLLQFFSTVKRGR